MLTQSISGLPRIAALALLVAGCRGDATGTTAAEPQLVRPISLHVDDDRARFSDWSAPANLGEVVNSAGPDFDPWISKDGLSLFFASGAVRGGFGLMDLWVSRRTSTDAPWGPPQNLGETINSAGRENSPTLSRDGHRMYFASDRPGTTGNFDLYVSRRRDKHDDFGWETPIHLGSVINSAAEENRAVVFEDESTGETVLYFGSNRLGGAGSFDIYASVLLEDGSFGPPAPVTELNSPSSDMRMVISRDGLELILSSDRPGTLGLHDLWVATRATTDVPWSAPTHLGAEINAAANDWGPTLSSDGTTLIFNSASRPENIGGRMFDLYVSTRERVRGRN